MYSFQALNFLKCTKEDVLDNDIIGKLPECINQDIFSADIMCNLPECIKHKILVYLPIKEAVRTSILSKDWRHTWTAIPDLVIDCNIDPTFNQNNGDKEESMIEKLVNQLFSCHEGNLHKFRVSGLKHRMFCTSSWMRILSQKHISELILEACPDHQYIYITVADIKLCLKLRVLVLSSCHFYLPTKFDGFKLLHTIEIRNCCLSDKGITDLVSFCPLLEKLSFELLSYDEQIIIIDSLSLRELTIYGKFAELSLLAPNLYMLKFVTTSRTVELRGNFIKLPVYINDILSDDASCYFLQKYPPTLNCPTTMVIIVAPPNLKHRTYNANELFGASMLQKLIVYLEPVDPSSVSNSYTIQDQIFPCLQEAIIIPLFSSKTVFEFAEFILTCAPQLKRLTIRGEMKDPDVAKWNEIHKLSMKVEILFSKSCFDNAEGKFEGCCCSMCDIMAW
ncbi:F-box/FBD/LRR protein [Rhynchospora pubera]|uniref:F-box/FBD/LRR protein n=1 Tax=Rhynchospora pubera TaxID=906938 RepID=A0AAV8BYG7_9POAL|nr:F-box/FBD/LRR protein [Rhynchospora pubera]